MRKIYLSILIILSSFSVNAQLTIPGLALKNQFNNFKKGDTLMITGMDRFAGEPANYYVKNGEKTYKADIDKIKLLNDSLGFWDMMWLKYASETYIENESLKKEIASTDKTVREFLVNESAENNILTDEVLNEYLNNVLWKIIPCNYRKLGIYSIRIVIINRSAETVKSYPNGVILITSGYLLGLKSEKDLGQKLGDEIAKIILNSYSETGQPDQDLIRVCSLQREHFKDSFDNSIPDEFLNTMYSLIVQSAWENYTETDYPAALALLQRFKNDDLTDNEIVLKSRLYRKLYDSPARNIEALQFINESIDRNSDPVIELYLEKAIILNRLGQYIMALTSLEIYSQKLAELENSGRDVSREKLNAKGIQISINQKMEQEDLYQ